MYRQGDILILESAIPVNAQKVPASNAIILARGEVTGHAHTITVDASTVDLFTVDGATAEAVDRWLRVGASGATVVHQEHGTITLPPGEYVVRRQREYTPAAIRQVAD